MVQQPDHNNSQMLIGWIAISQHLDISVTTARRWSYDLGLPVADRGRGAGYRVFTSKSLIDQWIYARATVRRDAILKAREARRIQANGPI